MSLGVKLELPAGLATRAFCDGSADAASLEDPKPRTSMSLPPRSAFPTTEAMPIGHEARGKRKAVFDGLHLAATDSFARNSADSEWTRHALFLPHRAKGPQHFDPQEATSSHSSQDKSDQTADKSLPLDSVAIVEALHSLTMVLQGVDASFNACAQGFEVIRSALEVRGMAIPSLFRPKGVDLYALLRQLEERLVLCQDEVSRLRGDEVPQPMSIRKQKITHCGSDNMPEPQYAVPPDVAENLEVAENPEVAEKRRDAWSARLLVDLNQTGDKRPAPAAAYLDPPLVAENIQGSEDEDTDEGGVDADESFASAKGGVLFGQRKRMKLPDHATQALRKWLDQHKDRPYPSEDDKSALTSSTGLSLVQINNWFSNARRRYIRKDLSNSSSSSRGVTPRLPTPPQAHSTVASVPPASTPAASTREETEAVTVASRQIGSYLPSLLASPQIIASAGLMPLSSMVNSGSSPQPPHDSDPKKILAKSNV